MRKFFRRATKSGKRKPLRKKAKAKKANKLVTKRQLYRAINRSIETKIVTATYSLTAFNSGISAAGDLITVLPGIVTGTNQNDRIGMSVKPTRLVIRGYIVYNTASSYNYVDAKLLGARLLCFQDKATRAYQNAISNYNLLETGGSGATFTGTPLNYLQPVNRDQFQIFADRRMKILKPFGYTNSSSPMFDTAMQSVDGSIFRPFTIVLTQKHMPAYLKFDHTDSPSYPVNFAPYLACGYCDLLNSTPDVTNTQLSITFTSTLYFKDA